MAPDGTKQRVLRYENLGPMSRKGVSDILSQRLVEAGKDLCGRE